MNTLDLLKKQVKQGMKNDSSHDFDHIMRVYENAKKLCKQEKVDTKLVLSAVLLHDLISYPKSDKRSKFSAIKSAKEAKKILQKFDYDSKEIEIITNAIRDHSFTSGKTPQTIEGKILQDADRLDAIGAIGIARVFAVAGSENRPFYNRHDPFCAHRPPNDQNWTLDHFYQKLLKLEKLMNTKNAKIEAKKRTGVIKRFLNDLKREI